MGTTAEMEVVSTEQEQVSYGIGMRSLWGLDGGARAAEAPERQLLGSELHRLLEQWRAAERQVAELADHPDASPEPATTTNLVNAISTYRVEHQRIFEAIRQRVLHDEKPEDDEEYGAHGFGLRSVAG